MEKYSYFCKVIKKYAKKEQCVDKLVRPFVRAKSMTDGQASLLFRYYRFLLEVHYFKCHSNIMACG